MNVKYPYTRSYRDRHGKLRIEYRRGGRTIALRATPGTAEFQDAYDAAKELFASKETIAAPSQVHSGTLRWLCVEYFKSVEFEQLAPSTQRARRLVFEGMLQEPTKPDSPYLFADCPWVASLPSTSSSCGIARSDFLRRRTSG